LLWKVDSPALWTIGSGKSCSGHHPGHAHLDLGMREEVSLDTQRKRLAYCFLECYYAVNTIGAEDAELAFVITAEVDETAVTLAGAG
jgi:hypothetical protein